AWAGWPAATASLRCVAGSPACHTSTRRGRTVWKASGRGCAITAYTGTIRQTGAIMTSDFIVLSHREPYDEVKTEGGTEFRRKTNGVFTTLDSVMRQRRGTWIAWKEHASGELRERVRVPSEDDPESYIVRRIPLDPEEARRFYYDFTSTAL